MILVKISPNLLSIEMNSSSIDNSSSIAQSYAHPCYSSFLRATCCSYSVDYCWYQSSNYGAPTTHFSPQMFCPNFFIIELFLTYWSYQSSNSQQLFLWLLLQPTHFQTSHVLCITTHIVQSSFLIQFRPLKTYPLFLGNHWNWLSMS